jgi:hypothetical protein
MAFSCFSSLGLFPYFLYYVFYRHFFRLSREKLKFFEKTYAQVIHSWRRPNTFHLSNIIPRIDVAVKEKFQLSVKNKQNVGINKQISETL